MRCSLYVHLPFCRSKCRYCDFYSVADREELIDGYLDAVAREWELHTERTSVELTSVYIGGGTPSLLSMAQWEYFGSLLFDKLTLVNDAEWTVECNPESFTEEKARLFADMGVNRLTFGIQSMQDRELVTAGRPHTSHEVLKVLAAPVLRRFRSVAVDVIYGLPGQTLDSFADTLRQLLYKPVVRHFSAYELTLVEGTPFGRHRSLLPFPAEDELEEIVHVLGTAADRYGFRQYEVSNYARMGYECRHNIGYWNHSPYIGLGCAAHSYLHPYRSWNITDIAGYCSRVREGLLPVERREKLSAEMAGREMIFLGLRQRTGIDEERFTAATGIPFASMVSKTLLERFRADGYLEFDSPCWKPTKKGLLFADFMARELF
ncbi:MAG: radical SAM family heme chaperone HemW [Chitinispirillaceae bacterium]|nr:radical SAM family heme chaperone HemW [Chitinispirillaceae bacterium]